MKPTPRHPGAVLHRVAALLLATIAVGLPAPATAAPDAANLDTIAQRMLPCAVCHGEEGRATNDGFYPRIAGKPAGYLYRQLLNFREGRRLNAQMTYLLERQTGTYLREMAQYFSDLELPYPLPPTLQADPARLERGRLLAVQGDTTAKIPSCQACHGERLTGVAPDVPGLLGLPYDYLVAQFGAWREGNRSAVAPDCMAEITHRLSPEDIGAVAAWLSTRPLPADMHPAIGFAQELPLRCGSVDAAQGASR